MGKLSQAILLFIACIWALPGYTQVAVDKLSQQFNQYQTLSGDFVQTLVDEKGETLQSSSGEFVIQQPGYFRWDTKAPFPQLLVSNLESIWLYDPDLEQVTVRPYTTRADQAPSLLLSGDSEQIAKYYEVQENAEQQNQFTLSPKDKESPFVAIELTFDQSLLAKMVLKDSLQQVTTFEFSEVRQDQSFPLEQFVFVPPEGTDVLIDE